MTARADEAFHELNQAAADWYTRPQATEVAANYLTRRAINPADIPITFTTGYAAPGWTQLTDHLRRSGHPDQDILAAGLATRCRTGTLIDTFRDRVMFAIRDSQGNIAGFTGRDLSGRATAKYLNTRTTTVFNKHALLYGLHEGRTDHPFVATPVLVEGPVDVLAIAAAQHAVTGNQPATLLPVASCGTTLSPQQVTALATHVSQFHSPATPAPPVVIALDGDRAGRTAALRNGDRLRTADLTVLITPLPNGLDPAELVATTPDALEYFTPHSAIPLIEIVTETLLARVGSDLQWIEGKLAAVRAVAGHLTTYPAHIALPHILSVAGMISLQPSTAVTELAIARRSAIADEPLGADTALLTAALDYHHAQTVDNAAALEGAITRWTALTGLNARSVPRCDWSGFAWGQHELDVPHLTGGTR